MPLPVVVQFSAVETTEDLRGMIAADGILTSRGGVSSHAALVARQMNKVCVCGASDVVINYGAGTLTVGEVLKEEDDISINGTTGAIYAGRELHRRSEPSSTASLRPRTLHLPNV